jgi:hypothetical protein
LGYATDSVVQGYNGAAPLLNSVSRTTLAALSVGLALGVALPREAYAGSGVVNPNQTSMYILGTFNPITFGAGTRINAGSNVGVYGGSSVNWTVTNYGSIQGLFQGLHLASSGSTVTNWGTIGETRATAGTGVMLPNGGAVTNQSGGSISGYAGVYIGGIGGAVTNAGSITGSATAVFVTSGSVDNESGGTLSVSSGHSHLAVYVGKGGSITNAGNITSAANNTAVVAIGGGGTVTNSGTISATNAVDAAVYTLNGGTVTNTGTIIVTAASSAGVYLLHGGTLSNSGNISASGNNNRGVWMPRGGMATNSRTITATAAGSIGVGTESGGTVDNESGGTISGANAGVMVSSGTGSVTNAGTIRATTTSSYAVSLRGGGTVSNTGTSSGGRVGIYIGGGSAATNSVTNSGGIYGTGTNSAGVDLGSGGTVTNNSGGTISGPADGVFVAGGAGTVINSGDIHGTAASGNGVILTGGGTVTNTGTITGGHLGIYVRGGGGTVTNAGTITGGALSVAFAGSGTNTLTLQTGSTLDGTAYGSTASGAVNALILQGQGSANNNFVSFKTLNAEATGTWTLGGNSAFGDTKVSTGSLSVTGVLTSTTLEILASAQFKDSGAVTVTGAVTNSGNLTINGVRMNVVGAGGTFTQLAGGTTTLLNGGVLDPSNIVVDRGVFGGSGSMVGDVSVTGGTVEAGAGPGGSLKILGNFLQTGGEIVFKVDPNGHGGFIESTLDFGAGVMISDTTFVFDFLNGANAQQFIADDLLNLNTFFGLTGGGSQFCTELNCGSVLQDISFADNVPGLTITGFDPTTGAIDPTIGAMSVQAVPEPGTWALLITGMLGLAGLKLRRRRRGEPSNVSALPSPST